MKTTSKMIVTQLQDKVKLTDENGNIATINDSGNLKTTNAESGLAIAKGDVIGSKFIHKFGKAPLFDVSDGFVTIWDGAEKGELYTGMQYIYSITDDIDTISSDTAGNNQLIQIQGLDINYDIVTQEKSLNGQSPVTLDTPLIRVFRMKNIGTVDIVGHAFVSVSGTLTTGSPTPANLRSVIHDSNNQTLMAVFTIPSGYTGYMRDWYASSAGAKRTSVHEMKLFVRPFGQVFQLKHDASISIVGTSYIHHKYEEPEVFAEKTDIEMRVNTDEADASISGGFDIVLVLNV